MHTIACLLIQTPKVFSWLGHMPVMNWTLEKLHEVRGVDAVVAVATADLVERAGKLLKSEDIKVCPIPERLKNLEDWLCSAAGPAADAELLVTVKPACVPFLPAGKIEECINIARRKQALCVPSRKVGGNQLKIDGVRAFVVQAAAGSRPTHTVPISMIEALDVSDAEQKTVADALIQCGKV